MENFNWIVIHGWMINELKLDGKKLLAYAIIFGFSQDGETEYTGGNNYLLHALNTSKPTLLKILKELCEEGLIKKITNNQNGVLFNKYKAILRGVKEFYGGSNSLTEGGQIPLPNNKYIYNKLKKTKQKKFKRKTTPKQNKLPQFYSDYSFFKKDFQTIWFDEFLPLKKRKKASVSETALKRQLNKISKFSENNYKKALQILTKSVDSGWSDFYELKEEKKYTNNIGSRNYTESNFQEEDDEVWENGIQIK